jgi:ABC-type microcin C transport system permease subunit YejB
VTGIAFPLLLFCFFVHNSKEWRLGSIRGAFDLGIFWGHVSDSSIIIVNRSIRNTFISVYFTAVLYDQR